MRRSATNVLATAIQESTAIYKQTSRRCTARLAQRLWLDLQQQSPRIRRPTSMDMEPDCSSLYFYFAVFYLQVPYSRVDDDFKGRLQQVTERQVRRSHGGTADKREDHSSICDSDPRGYEIRQTWAPSTTAQVFISVARLFTYGCIILE